MQIHYLEIVTPDVDAVCSAYVQSAGAQFCAPEESLGNARVADIAGGRIGVRAPMHESETPVIRPYFLVDDLESALSSVVKTGGEIIHPAMEIPGFGKFAIYNQGGNQLGLWEV